MTTEKKSRVNADLDKYLSQLLKDVMKTHADPTQQASLTDRMKVIDRVLKWEFVKHKLQDGDWGTGFNE